MRNVLDLNSTFTLGVSLHSPKTIPRPSLNVVGTCWYLFFETCAHGGTVDGCKLWQNGVDDGKCCI